MLLRDLKSQMLLPREEYIINQRAAIRGLDVALLSFTIEQDKNGLWLIYSDEAELRPDVWGWPGFASRREKMLHHIDSRRDHLHITAMEVGQHRIKFDSSTAHPVFGQSMEAYMQLQHFAERSLLPQEWHELPVENLVIAHCQQVAGEPTPDMRQASQLPVVLNAAGSSREMAIQQPFVVRFGKQPVGTTVKYFDPLLGRGSYCFIDEIYAYDAYQQMIRSLGQITDAKMRKAVRKRMLRAMASHCPQDKYLAVIRYEAPENVQLRFYMQGYLEAEPVSNNTSGVIGFRTRNDQTGVNGYPVRECVLQPVDKGFCGEMQLELFSRVQEIPSEVVTCSLSK